MDNRADYLLIAPSELKTAAASLAGYRESQGFTTMIVDLEDIMDEFNHGRYSPKAIQAFLFHAYHRWRQPPQYVVLVGEGTYDYKDFQGFGDNLVPPLMVSTPFGLYASDNRFADVVGDDGIPEMAIGRLPVVTPEELAAVVEKLIDYEAGLRYRDRRVLLVADNADAGGNFPLDSDRIGSVLPLDLSADKIYLSEHSLNDARQLIMDGLNQGALLVNYLGHGGVDRLANEGMFQTGDVARLENGDTLPVLTAMSCVVGQFAIPGYDSLSEALVLGNRAGAVAVWSPTGLSMNSQAVLLDEAFILSVFSGRNRTLGQSIVEAAETHGFRTDRYILDIFTLLGDPALKMQ